MSASNNYHIIQPSGTLTAPSTQDLIQEATQAIEQEIKYLLIDMQNVDFIDSAGSSALLSIHTKMDLLGGKLCLCSLNHQAKTLFNINNMDRIFEVYENRSYFLRAIEPI
jgi:stage II sporulation protein AA (anti-sigma F factor antagonist)